MKNIYLIFDRYLGCVSKATTNHSKALEEVKKLNENERTTRYTICTYKDFATK